MPSCVINSCKLNTSVHKKSIGITYHRFPCEMRRRKEWIGIIRKNRNDADWVPTKSNIICSLHFEDCDVYQTPGGLLRIKKNAVPKKIHLVGSEWCTTPIETDNNSERETLPPAPPFSAIPVVNSEGSIKTEKSDTEQSSCEEIPLVVAEWSIKTENPDTPPECQRSPPLSLSVEYINKLGDPGNSFDYTPKNLTDDDDRRDAEPEIRDSDLESIFDSPETYELKQKLRKYIARCKIKARKIQTLNKRVKRLLTKNAELKRLVKSLKREK